MRAIEEAGATMVEKDGKVKYKGKGIEVHQYEKTEAGEDGGFEFEWVLNKKPKSNVLRTTIQHKGLDFFYQPALTAEEIKQGDVRPENVVGSYAVYHSTKRNNIVGGMEYQTGKAFHIYRPHAVDAKGVQVWCELDIKEGELTVTVPEDFLDKASYPVVVDPTFGYSSVGASDYTIGFGGEGLFKNGRFSKRVGNVYTLGVSGDVESISAYTSGNNSTNIKALFNEVDGDGSNLHSQIAIKENTGVSNTAHWETFSFAESVAVSATGYTPNIVVDIDVLGEDNYSYIKYDSTDIRRLETNSIGDNSGYTGLTSPWNTNNFNSNSYETGSENTYSIYATYTEAAPSYNPAFAHRRLLL